MGPLPPLYRLLLAVLLVGLCLAAGVRLAAVLALPLGGIGVGLLAGALLSVLLTHDFTRRRAR